MVVVLIVALVLIGVYFVKISLERKTPEQLEAQFGGAVEGIDSGKQSPADITARQVLAEQTALADQWSDTTASQTWNVTSGDGLKLAATYYPQPASSPSHLWVIAVHGYSGTSREMGLWGRHFCEKGYNAVTPDLRSHGASEGSWIGMGWPDRKDMLLWIDKIVRHDPQANIVLLGVSMGGATTMMTTGETLPTNVRAAVEDCGYTSAWDEFEYQLDRLYHLPSFPILYAASVVGRVRARYFLQEASALDQVKKSRTPTLFIHGAEDQFVPTCMVHSIYEASSAPDKQLLIIPGAGHGRALVYDLDNYWQTIWAFLRKHVPAS
jgi:fermentation-respiration switch protein FrsA (DUF1100 family)